MYTQLQEWEWIRGLRQHQPEALEALMAHYCPYVGTIIRNILGNTMTEADVEELTADVFVAAWEHADALKPGKIKAYLGAIARNRARNRIRRFRETIPLEDLIEIPAGDNIEETIDQHVLSEILRDVLENLPAKDREILVRHYYYYETARQIADALHMKESAVKMRMMRARQKLQQELIDRGYGYEDSPAVQQIRFAAGKNGKGVPL